MKNYIQRGATCTFRAPYAVASGGGFKVGVLFAIANAAAAPGEEVEGDLSGVFRLPKAAGAATGANAGTKVFWDDAAKKVTKTGAGNLSIGALLEDSTNDATDCVVRLDGIAGTVGA